MLKNVLAIVGGFTGGRGVTVIWAVAVRPGPLSFEVTAPVVLVSTPVAAPFASTFTSMMQLKGATEKFAPDRLTDPAVAVTVPPQLEINPFGVATTNPVGSVSVNPTPVRFP